MGQHTPHYPTNDNNFEDVSITEVRVEKTSGGWSIQRSDGWSFWVPKDSPIAPAVGMTARFYPAGIGFPVRGLFLDGVQVYYRTADEENQYQEDVRYGKDAVDMIRKWDAGESIWSLALGGFGPGYEQALQVAAVEFAREGLDVPLEGPKEGHAAIWREVCDHALLRAKGWGDGLSGAMFGAASWLSWQWVHGAGPAGVIKNAEAKGEASRVIQVSKSFAHSGPVTAAAPDLLAALQLVRMSAGWQYLSDESKTVIDAALRAATGDQS